ncbi:MAG: hypothetical protein WBL28_04235 [Methylotenera sp.]
MSNRPTDLAPENNVITDELVEEKIIATSEAEIGADDESAVVDDVVKLDSFGRPIPNTNKRKVAGTHHKINHEKVGLHAKAISVSNQGGGGGHGQDDHEHHHTDSHHDHHGYSQIDPLAVAAEQALIGPQHNLSEEKNGVLSEILARIHIVEEPEQDIAQEKNNTPTSRTTINPLAINPATETIEKEL